MNRVVFLLSSAFALLLVTPAARASDAFPETIKSELKLETVPLCTLCHQTLIGGRMTITKPFGITMQTKYGLKLLDVPGLRKALADMQTANPPDDSDGDGIGDIAELVRGTDPNVKEGETAVDEGPMYGCQCSTPRPSTGFSSAAAAWAAGLVIAAVRARRSRQSSAEAPTRSGHRPARPLREQKTRAVSGDVERET
jgi:hypothetical protein